MIGIWTCLWYSYWSNSAYFLCSKTDAQADSESHETLRLTHTIRGAVIPEIEEKEKDKDPITEEFGELMYLLMKFFRA